jgi:hypothetical protein
MQFACLVKGQVVAIDFVDDMDATFGFDPLMSVGEAGVGADDGDGAVGREVDLRLGGVARATQGSPLRKAGRARFVPPGKKVAPLRTTGNRAEGLRRRRRAKSGRVKPALD